MTAIGARDDAMTAPALRGLRRLVIKIGSALLVDGDGRVDRVWLESLATDVAALRDDGHQVILVSSGAVAIGSRVLGLSVRRARLEELQAAAAAGQVQLVHAYQDVLARFGISAAQVLLTPDDTEIRRRFLNARNTLEKLVEFGVVPVINENDTVATQELKYGDNDRLAARVAQTVMADGLVLLSDVDGLYTADPRTDPTARHVPVVRDIGADLFAMAGQPGAVGRGGMKTKLQAAQIATHAGCTTFIASGAGERPLRALADGGKCTVFLGDGSPAAARKQWLAGVLEVRGELRLDAGAVAALRRGNSLLPIGVVEVIGRFRRGDAVTLVDTATGRVIGRGLAAYASDEAARILGCRSQDIPARLGYQGRSVIVHRDDLVLFGEPAGHY